MRRDALKVKCLFARAVSSVVVPGELHHLAPLGVRQLAVERREVEPARALARAAPDPRECQTLEVRRQVLGDEQILTRYVAGGSGRMVDLRPHPAQGRLGKAAEAAAGQDLPVDAGGLAGNPLLLPCLRQGANEAGDQIAVAERLRVLVRDARQRAIEDAVERLAPLGEGQAV